MKGFRIVILILILVLAGTSQISALDVGGSVSSATSFSTSAGLANEEGVGLWLETGKSGPYSFKTKLDFIFSASDPGFYFNPDYLKLDALYEDLEYGPSVLATSLGRFRMSDFSGKIFSQKLDGFSINFSYPAVELRLSAGYTGLFFADTGSLLTTSPSTTMSKTDAAQKSNAADLFEALTDPAAAGRALFQSPRAVEIITLTLPQVLLRQSITLSFVAQEDMRPMFDILSGYSAVPAVLLQEGESIYYGDQGGAVDTQYIGAGVSGPLIDSLYHKVYYYFGTGRAMSYTTDASSATGSSYSYDTIISHLAGFSLDYYMSWLFNSKVGLAVSFSTGDADATTYFEGNTSGDYNQFLPITNGGGGIIFSPGISNIISGNLSFSAKPLENLDIPFVSSAQFVLNAMPFFRTVAGPVYVSGINPAYTGNYLGTEIDLTVNLRPFSDLGIITQLGYFLPEISAFTAADPIFMAKLNVSFSY
ncbi:MAG: hypothetical protein JEZ04_03825 [Spirochaetales bacterium]|nr:hypothetical protein [Spirochaetales bacterium]